VSSWFERPSVVTAGDEVLQLSKDMTPEALRAVLTVAGGEKITRDTAGWTIIEDGRDRPRKGP
jgi:hypothetical protein